MCQMRIWIAELNQARFYCGSANPSGAASSWICYKITPSSVLGEIGIVCFNCNVSQTALDRSHRSN
jgi:hypothetical protein